MALRSKLWETERMVTVMLESTSVHKDIEWRIFIAFSLPPPLPPTSFCFLYKKMSLWTPDHQALEEILRTIYDSTDMTVAAQRSITLVSLALCCHLTKILIKTPRN